MPSLLSCSSHAVSAEQCDISVAKIRCPTGVVKVTACSNGLHGLDTIEPAQHIDRYQIKSWSSIRYYIDLLFVIQF